MPLLDVQEGDGGGVSDAGGGAAGVGVSVGGRGGAGARFASSPGEERSFCRVCGSTLPTFFGDGSEVGLPLGTLDVDPGVRPSAHVWVDSKAPWWTIEDGLPQYAEGNGPGKAPKPAG